MISRAECAGLIEALALEFLDVEAPRFPALNARASLKPCILDETGATPMKISRAECAGLIEASCTFS